MALDWLRKRIVKSGLKYASEHPEKVQKLLQSGSNGPDTGKTGANMVLPDLNPGTPDEESGSGDIVLDSLYDLLDKAKKAQNMTKVVEYANAIEKRELTLIRRAAGTRGRSRQLGRNLAAKSEDEEDEPEQTAPTQSFDMANFNVDNLAPHADEIAGELIAMLPDKMGDFDLAGMKGMAKGTISEQIRKNPDIVPKAMVRIQNLLAGIAGPKSSSAASPPQGVTKSGRPMIQVGGVALDPEHPETWPPGFAR